MNTNPCRNTSSTSSEYIRPLFRAIDSDACKSESKLASKWVYISIIWYYSFVCIVSQEALSLDNKIWIQPYLRLPCPPHRLHLPLSKRLPFLGQFAYSAPTVQTTEPTNKSFFIRFELSGVCFASSRIQRVVTRSCPIEFYLVRSSIARKSVCVWGGGEGHFLIRHLTPIAPNLSRIIVLFVVLCK